MAGEQTLPIEEYGSIQFQITNSHPVEVILLQEGLVDWNDRLRFTIPAHTQGDYCSISFMDFVDGNGHPAAITNVKTVVFSLHGNYSSYEPFELKVNELAFNKSAAFGNDTDDESAIQQNLSAYPNPMTVATTIQFSSPQEDMATCLIYNQLGKLVYQSPVQVTAGNNKLFLKRNDLNTGLYFVKIISRHTSHPPLKLLVK